MVENLTLSKLAVQPESLTSEQIAKLPETLEDAQPSGERRITLRATYKLDNQTLISGSKVRLRHAGGFRCTLCDRSVKKLFDGFCYPCLQNSAQADRCVLNPVGCHYTQGSCREPHWGEEFCYQPHYVYLAYTDKFKVGITRRTQIPTRWMDQGATMAVLLVSVGSRHQAGVLEDYLAQTFADKSHWMKMLKSGNSRPSLDEFETVREQALKILTDGMEAAEAQKLRVPVTQKTPSAADVRLLDKACIVEIEFPLWTEIPEKISSLNLDKSPELESSVLGIKGQYLFLENGVFNVRRHEGYVVNCEIAHGHGPGCAK